MGPPPDSLGLALHPGVSQQTDDFERLIVASLPFLRRYARAMVQDRAAADDLVQDVVLRALEKRHLFAAGTNITGWLGTIMHNQCVNAVRHAARPAHATHLASLGSGEIFDQGTLPQLDNLQAVSDPSVGLLVRDVERALRRLPREQQLVVVLAGKYGMGYDDIAEALALNIGTVRSRLSRGRSQMRAMCGEPAKKLRRGGGAKFISSGPRRASPARLQIQVMTAQIAALHPDWVRSHVAARAVEQFLRVAI